MKRIKILLLLFFLVTGFSVNAMSLSPQSRNNGQHNGNNGQRNGNNGQNNGNNRNHNGNGGRNGGHCPPVGTPLDGGLLTVLGVAGVGYYVARKKGKKPES